MSNFRVWIREHGNDLLLWLGLFLLITFAFAAGYLAAGMQNPAPIIIEKCSG